MATSIEFLSAARVEFDQAFDWYASRSHGAAIGFASAVEDVIDKVLAGPERFARTYAGCQYCPLPRYPYSLVYYSTKGRVTFVAVAHAKRRPGYWRTRLQ